MWGNRLGVLMPLRRVVAAAGSGAPHREHCFSLRLPQRAHMAVARPVFDGAAEYGLRRCYRFFLARIGAVFVKIRAYKGQTSDPAFARAQLFFNLGNIAIGASRRLRLQLSNLGTERPHFFAYLCGREKPRASHVSERLVETRLVGNCLPYVDCVRECGVNVALAC